MMNCVEFIREKSYRLATGLQRLSPGTLSGLVGLTMRRVLNMPLM